MARTTTDSIGRSCLLDFPPDEVQKLGPFKNSRSRPLSFPIPKPRCDSLYNLDISPYNARPIEIIFNVKAAYEKEKTGVKFSFGIINKYKKVHLIF